MGIIERIKLLLRITRAVKETDADAEKKGGLRFLKVLVIGAAGAIGAAALSQSGSGCVLGDTACKLLAIPEVQQGLAVGIAAALAGLEKYLNEKVGVGLQSLDTVDRK